jgi:very-short-patch-repair endonuclease
VVRVWQHEIEKNVDGCVQRIEGALRQRTRSN